MQSAYIVNTDNGTQSWSRSSSHEIDSLEYSSTLSSPETVCTSSSNLIENDPLTLSLCSYDTCNSKINEKITAGQKQLEDIQKQLIKDTAVTCITQVEKHFEEATVEHEQNQETEDLNDVEAAPIQVSKKSSTTQQQRSQSPIPDVNIEESEVTNPLFVLLHKNGSHLRKLICDIHRNNLVPIGHDINFIGKVTAKHLLHLATPPQRKIPTSTLIRWSKYFKRLFPKTPTSAFYAFKYEPYTRRDGTVLQRKRAEGVLQVQLFQERRKLIKENRDTLLRQPCTKSIVKDSNPSNDMFNITKLWRSVSQSEGEIPSSVEILREGF